MKTHRLNLNLYLPANNQFYIVPSNQSTPPQSIQQVWLIWQLWRSQQQLEFADFFFGIEKSKLFWLQTYDKLHSVVISVRFIYYKTLLALHVLYLLCRAFHSFLNDSLTQAIPLPSCCSINKNSKFLSLNFRHQRASSHITHIPCVQYHIPTSHLGSSTPGHIACLAYTMVKWAILWSPTAVIIKRNKSLKTCTLFNV